MSCPPGKELNPVTNRCRYVCLDGFTRNSAGVCIKPSRSKTKKNKAAAAPRDDVLYRIERELHHIKQDIATLKQKINRNSTSKRTSNLTSMLKHVLHARQRAKQKLRH